MVNIKNRILPIIGEQDLHSHAAKNSVASRFFYCRFGDRIRFVESLQCFLRHFADFFPFFILIVGKCRGCHREN